MYSDFGFVFEDMIEANSYQYDTTLSSLNIGSSLSITEAFGVIELALSQKADSYTRSFIKLQSLVANIGGVVNFFYIVAMLIVRYVTSKSLLLAYVKNRLTNFKLDPKPDANVQNNTDLKFVSFNNGGVNLVNNNNIIINNQNLTTIYR